MLNGKQNILIVDDDPIVRKVLGSILKDLGAISYAVSGEEAFSIIEKQCLDVILLDVEMPGMGGYEACKRLKGNEKTKSIPIVFLTGNTTNKDEEECLELGASDFIRKPISPRVVHTRISNVLTLQAALHKFEKLALTDVLTGAYNRRHFLQVANAEFSRSKRYESDLTLMMLDIDFFKKVNDTYGHDIGDEALIRTVSAIQDVLRSEDTLSRFGGEEFIILLPETKIEKTQIVAERVLNAIREIKTPTSKGDLTFTISGGFSEVTSNDEGIEAVIKRADEALYSAKETGRGKIVHYGD